MKTKIFFSLFFAVCFTAILGQSPQAFKYQAVIRDTSGISLSEKNISLRISILKSDIGGEEVYKETHNVWTDKLGLVHLNIGQGLDPSNVFSEIPWGEDIFFIRVEMDLEGGTAYHLLGISQLLAVPYALYAERSGDDIWKETNNGIYYNGDNVGIGTPNPNATLDVEDSSGENQEFLFEGKVSDAPDDFFRIYNGTGNYGQFIPALWGHHQSDNRIAFGLIGTISSDTDYGTEPVTIFASRIYDGDWNFGDIQNRPLFSWRKLYEDKMTMLANGFLGLGTTNPSTLFHIEGTSVSKEGRELLTIKNNSQDELSSAIVKIMSGEDSTSTLLMHTAKSYEWQGRSQMGMLGNDGKGIILAATDSLGEIRFETGGAGIDKERMRITEVGRVGIGTSDPQNQMLRVETTANGGNERAIAYFKNNSNSSSSLCNLIIGSGDIGSTYLSFVSATYAHFGGKYKTHTLLGNNGKGLVFRTGQNDEGRIAFEFRRELGTTYTYDEKVSITYEGNMGIGIINPKRKLHINDVMRLEPRSTPPENPSEGDIYMDSVDHVLKVYDGTNWKSCW